MIAQRIDVVDSEFRGDNRRELGQIHAWLAVISPVVGRAFDISSKGPGCDGQSVSRFSGKVKIGLVLRLFTASEEGSAEGDGWKTLYEMATR
jgi:hypothetical protein